MRSREHARMRWRQAMRSCSRFRWLPRCKRLFAVASIARQEPSSRTEGQGKHGRWRWWACGAGAHVAGAEANTAAGVARRAGRTDVDASVLLHAPQ